MIGDGCQHVWLIPPAALERSNWHKKYRIKCKTCEKAQTVDGSYAQRNLAVRTIEPELIPVVAPEPATDSAEHDLSDSKEGWQGAYLFFDNDPPVIASGLEKVKEGDILLLSKKRRFLVRNIVVPIESGYCWVAEIEQVLL